jgi:ABC-type transporter MlaC component
VNRRRVLASFLSLAFLPVLRAVPAFALDGQTAAAFTDDLLKNVLGSVAGRKLPRAECAQLFQEMVARYVDLQGTSAAVLGPSWQRMVPEDRERFVQALAHYMAAIWSENMTEISPTRRFVVQHSEPTASGVLVHAYTIAPGDDPVPLEFHVASGLDGRPLLADVAFAGISVVRMLRADFKSVLFANSGRVDALLAAMRRKVELAALN